MSRKPNLYVVAAPSGGGKTSLISALLKRDERLRLSVSYTTRQPRPGEIDGEHYHFVSHETFARLVRNNAFLEHAEVFGQCYGTSREAVESHLAQGFDVMLDIDWQGARQVRSSFPSCCSIFILPPSLQELHRRLSLRGQDSAATIQRRMLKAQAEISHWNDFDYLVVNDDFDAALEDIHSIIRHRRHARPGQQERFTALLAELLGND